MSSTTRKTINVALGIIGVAGLAGITIVAPNALQGLRLLLKKTSTPEPDHARLLKELKRQGLVHISQTGDEIHFNLTPAGAYRLQEVVIEDLEIPKPNKWDKKWRLVSFDIPVKQSKQRQYFVGELQSLGFAMIHRSLWVHPYPCLDQIEQLAGHYNVLRYCTMMEVSRLDELSTRRLLRSFENLLS